jgi:hypothetical protein
MVKRTLSITRLPVTIILFAELFAPLDNYILLFLPFGRNPAANKLAILVVTGSE